MVGSFLIKPPVFLVGDGGLDVFATVGDAESYVEAVDVRNGEYGSAFDSEGRLLMLEVVEARPRLGWILGPKERVRLTPAEEAPSHREDLIRELSDRLERLGQQARGLPLARLVELATQHYRTG